MEYVISFIISYIAGNIPTVKDRIIGNKTMHTHLNDCFKRAVKRWKYAEIAKESISQNMDKYILHLNDFITLNNKGRHPKENELLQLWGEEILNDTECYKYISNLRDESIFNDSVKFEVVQPWLSR